MEKWGHESLKGFIAESELFDLTEERVDKNIIIELFKPKANLAKACSKSE
jgi:hypothetical protein